MGLPDRTFALARRGYHFSEWLQHSSATDDPAIPIRLLGRRSLVVRGREGVNLFYDDSRVERTGSTPPVLAETLFGRGAVHGLDGADHQHRKELFLQVTSFRRVDELARLVAAKWERETQTWVREGHGVVFTSAVAVFGEAAQEWAGVGDTPSAMRERSRDLARLVDGFGNAAPSWLQARFARRRLERWAERMVVDVRAGRRTPTLRSAAAVMAGATDRDGRLLPARTAAVELLNVLRPTVAVAYFAAFAALELEANPDLNDLCASDPGQVELFAQEVRRMSPFVPLLAARSRRHFTWRGHRVRRGDRLLLDVYGTDHDSSIWADADTFDPDRFRDGSAARPEFIPQGGGPVAGGHRCPGEGVTMALLRTVIAPMACLDWHIHPEDRVYSLRRIPARPEGGVRLLEVRKDPVARAR